MKLTKKKVLELTMELWQWLYDNPGSGKCDWPGWQMNGGANKAVCNCFACEYAFNSLKNGGCFDCPLLPLWPGGGCVEESSLYCQWTKTRDIELRKKYAKGIIDFCKKGGDRLCQEASMTVPKSQSM